MAQLALPGPAPSGADGVTTTESELASYVRRSMIAAALLVGIGGAWAGFAPLSGAVIAPGFVVVENNARSVQHLTGGIIELIKVKEGQQVAAGDVLIKLDETQARAQLSIIQTQHKELLVRKARLDAERAGRSEIEMTAELIAMTGSDPTFRRQIQLEQVVLDSRIKIAAGQVQQLRERITQIELDIAGSEEQLKSRHRQLELINSELQGLEGLFARNLVSMVRISGVRREQARLQGDIGNFVSEIARSRARIAETELQIIQFEQQRRSDINIEARETATKLAESGERAIALEDTLNRIEIRSPSDGVVHQLNAFTQGGIVRPGDTIMKVVPLHESLVFEARIQPRDIDQVRVGQQVAVRLLSANQATLRNLEGTLTAISPDITVEASTQQRYFTAKIGVEPGAADKAVGTKLVPGMPADIFIKTDERTALSYMLKPIVDQAARAFRER